MRILRLAIGLFIVVQGIVTKEWTFAAIGGFLTLMPLFNVGCCGSAGCKAPIHKGRQADN